MAAPEGAKPRHKRGHDYEVGFARPPKAKRWKPGQSGNPGGRPRKTLTLPTAFKDVLSEEITVKLDGVPVRMTIQQAVLRKLRDEALRGDRWAIRTIGKLDAAAPKQVQGPDLIKREMLRLTFEDALRRKELEESELA